MARFLFPEDEEQLRSVCRASVDHFGHVLDTTEEAFEARDRMAELEYDALVTDGHMPGMTGPELVHAVRASLEGRVPVAIKSASEFGDLEARGIGWSIPKPFGIQELGQACDDMVRARVDWLLCQQPAARRPLVSPDAVARVRRMRGIYRDPALGSGVLRAPSPRAAVAYLAHAVRDWHAMLSAPELDQSSLARLRRRRQSHLAPLHQEVLIGDARLRRLAARAPEPLRTRLYLALCCARYGWRWQLSPDLVLVVDPPVESHIENGAFHSLSGPALHYRDGWTLYALHNEPVAKHVITAPQRITLEQIQAQRNVEIRRILRERYGEGRYLTDTGAAMVDVDSVPIDALATSSRAITRTLVEDREGHRYLVASDGSTRRVYYMRVPSTCVTCREAYEALSGRPGMRTIVEA